MVEDLRLGWMGLRDVDGCVQFLSSCWFVFLFLGIGFYGLIADDVDGLDGGVFLGEFERFFV